MILIWVFRLQLDPDVTLKKHNSVLSFYKEIRVSGSEGNTPGRNAGFQKEFN